MRFAQICKTASLQWRLIHHHHHLLFMFRRVLEFQDVYDHEDFILNPYVILRCLLESMFEEGNIKEILGGDNSMEYFIRGKKISSHLRLSKFKARSIFIGQGCKMRKCRFFLALFIVLVAILFTLPPREDGETWAVLVAGSPGFKNYAMQADICGAYQILIKGKVKKDHIIVFMADDAVNDPKNLIPGSILNHPQGTDVYKGVSKDYTGKNLSLHNLAVLAGNKDLIEGGSGKVLATQANDRIFLFYSGHGRRGSILTLRRLLDVPEATLEEIAPAQITNGCPLVSRRTI